MAVGAAVVAAVGAATWAKRRGAEDAELEEAVQRSLPDHEEVVASAPVADPETVAAGDELTTIKGIGGVISGRLAEAGVSSYQQIADWDDDALEAIAAEIKVSPERIRREEWVSQAQALTED